MNRRRYLSVLAAASCLNGCSTVRSYNESSTTVAKPLPSQWPTAHADPRRTRHLPGEKQGFEETERPRLIEYEPDAALFSSPVLSDDTVFYTTGVEIVANGRHSWTYSEYGAGLDPVLHEATLYAQVDSGLLALDARTGSRNWRLDSVTAPGTTAPSPTVVHDTILVVTREAVHRVTPSGEQSWQAPHHAMRPMRLAANEYGCVVAGLTDSGAIVEGYTLDGNRIWEQTIAASAMGVDLSASLTEEAVVVLTDSGQLRVLDIRTGNERAQHTFPSGIVGWPSLADRRLLVPATADSQTVHAYDVEQASVAWTLSVPNRSYSLTTLGDAVLIPLDARTDDVIVAALADGTVQTTYRLDSELPPAYAVRQSPTGGSLVHIDQSA